MNNRILLFVCNRKILYYYCITLPSITITITFGNFQSITITGKSGCYILQLHITITPSLARIIFLKILERQSCRYMCRFSLCYMVMLISFILLFCRRTKCHTSSISILQGRDSKACCRDARASSVTSKSQPRIGKVSRESRPSNAYSGRSSCWRSAGLAEQ